MSCVEDGAIRFRDEDFEAYIRDHVKGEDVIAAHGRLADMFLNSRKTDPDAAAHVADHLSAAGRLPELVGLVLAEGSPAGIADGLRREQVQARRLDLAARAAAGTGDAAAAVRLAARGCDTASRTGTLSSWWNPGSTWSPATPTSTCSARMRFAKTAASGSGRS